MPTEEILLTRRETSDLLKVTLQTLNRWEHERRLVPIRLTPRTVRYRKADVQRFMEGIAAADAAASLGTTVADWLAS